MMASSTSFGLLAHLRPSSRLAALSLAAPCIVCLPQFGGAGGDLSGLELNSASAIASVGHSSPGPAFEFVSNVGAFVLFKNELPDCHLLQSALNDRRAHLHCGLFAPDCKPDVRSSVHFHGGHILPQFGQREKERAQGRREQRQRKGRGTRGGEGTERDSSQHEDSEQRQRTATGAASQRVSVGSLMRQRSRFRARCERLVASCCGRQTAAARSKTAIVSFRLGYARADAHRASVYVCARACVRLCDYFY